MRRKTLFVLIGLLIILASLLYLNHNVFDFQPEKIRKWIVSLGVIAPFIYIVLYSVRPFILFPASILSLAGGLAFGPIYGTLLTIAGASLGAYFALMLSRKIGGSWIEKKSGRRIEKVKKILEKNGFIVVLLLRLIPLFPFDLISYIAGLSKVKTSHFVLATVIGIIPGTFAYNFLGASTLSNNVGTIGLAFIVFFIVMIIPTLFQKRLKRFLDIKEEK